MIFDASFCDSEFLDEVVLIVVDFFVFIFVAVVYLLVVGGGDGGGVCYLTNSIRQKTFFDVPSTFCSSGFFPFLLNSCLCACKHCFCVPLMEISMPGIRSQTFCK